MSLEIIEKQLKEILKLVNEETFIYDFLLAYNQPKASINRLIKGDYNLSKKNNQVIWKKKIFYEKINENEDVHHRIDELSKENIVEKNNIRFIIVTDLRLFLAIDNKTNQTLDINLKDIDKYADFFLPLTGLEKTQNLHENLADLKAAEKMGKLYDKIIEDNAEFLKTGKDRHGLNIFFTRILFCFFAEDSDIFLKGLFTNSISSHTQEDGSDLKLYLEKLFKILNKTERNDCPTYLASFPYVNGGLFLNDYKIPKFSKESRKILIESGELNWSSINPDILGSMMQAVVHSGVRHELGMHYTSVTNILKVIKPLFLDKFYSDFHSSNDHVKKLKSILNKIYNLKIFDPACGSGNFLVISYKELYKIEIEILKKLEILDKNSWLIIKSGIELKQFFGIEKDDYAHEAAKLSLWIAQHQMNILFQATFNVERATLPLSPSGNITCGNALLFDWDKICPKKNSEMVYIIGNPPYVGSSMQNLEQKSDMVKVFQNIKNYKNLDYISCWFIKGAKYISNTSYQLSFVSTNSITQGEQVDALWPHIYNLNVEIGFAYKSFKWTNSAKGKAGVTCIILNLKKKSKEKKFLVQNDKFKIVNNINPYLIDFNSNIIIAKTTTPQNKFPEMFKGNMATDGGNLILNDKEKEDLILENKNSIKYLKKYIGSYEFFHGISRWCLWISDKEKENAMQIKSIKERIEKVKNFRLKSKSPGTKQAALYSHRFKSIPKAPTNALLVPAVSSENRIYVPYGFVDSSYIVSANSNVIFDPPLYVFSVLSSRMHMVWFRTVAGRLRTDFRYSVGFCYNPFPFPSINENQIKKLEEKALIILDEREKFSEMTLAQLYDSKKMPESLLKKHQDLDESIDNLYEKKGFISDDERIKYLFNQYEKNTNREKLI